MKKTVLTLALTSSLLASASFFEPSTAQTDKKDLIDSPSYVLSGSANTSTVAGTNVSAVVAGTNVSTGTNASAAKSSTKGEAAQEGAVKGGAQGAAQSVEQGSAAQGSVQGSAAQGSVQGSAAQGSVQGSAAQGQSLSGDPNIGNGIDVSPTTKPSKKTPKDLKRKGKLVYVSIELAPVFNWFSGADRPFENKGATFIVDPSILVEFDMGYYMFLGTGLSFNTAGGRLSFPSDYVNQHSNSGLSSYSNVFRSYSISYLELPITFKVQSNPVKEWSFFGEIGVHFGIKVTSTYKDIYKDFLFENPIFPNAPTVEGELYHRGKLDDKANLWSITSGLKLGTVRKLGSKASLRFGVGYHYSFLDALSKNHESSNGIITTVNAQQFEIFVGVTF